MDLQWILMLRSTNNVANHKALQLCAIPLVYINRMAGPFIRSTYLFCLPPIGCNLSGHVPIKLLIRKCMNFV